MDCLNLLAADMNYVGLNHNYDMQKESSKTGDKICRKRQNPAKIGLDPESDPDGKSESLSCR